MKKMLIALFALAALEYCGDDAAKITLNGQGSGPFYNYSCSNGKTFSHPFDGLAKAEAAGTEMSQVTEEDAVRTILGAASNEDDDVMYAIACAIRNRNNLDGIQERLAEIDHLPQDQKDRALKAWRKSFDGYDVVNGANIWYTRNINGNYVNAYQWLPKWAKKNDLRAEYGLHRFYKL